MQSRVSITSVTKVVCCLCLPLRGVLFFERKGSRGLPWPATFPCTQSDVCSFGNSKDFGCRTLAKTATHRNGTGALRHSFGARVEPCSSCQVFPDIVTMSADVLNIRAVATRINPLVFSTWEDEKCLARFKALGKRCHGGSMLLRSLQRYILMLSLRWDKRRRAAL